MSIEEALGIDPQPGGPRRPQPPKGNAPFAIVSLALSPIVALILTITDPMKITNVNHGGWFTFAPPVVFAGLLVALSPVGLILAGISWFRKEPNRPLTWTALSVHVGLLILGATALIFLIGI